MSAIPVRPSAPDIRSWPARRSTGGEAALWTAVAVLVLAAAAAIVAAAAAPGAGVLLWTILAIALAACSCGLLVLGLAYRQLAYALDDQALRIRWLGQTLSVPYASIEGIYTGQRMVGSAVPKGLTWPGIYVGRGRARDLGRVRYFSTSPDPSTLTVVASATMAVVVSASDPQAFRAALIEHVQAIEPSDSDSLRWTRAADETVPWSALRDPWFGISLAVAFLLLLITLTAIVVGFGTLSPTIPLRFDAVGQPSLIVPAEELLRVPLLAIVLSLLNAGLGIWLHPREPLLARLLWVGGASVLPVTLVAVLRLLQ